MKTYPCIGIMPFPPSTLGDSPFLICQLHEGHSTPHTAHATWGADTRRRYVITWTPDPLPRSPKSVEAVLHSQHEATPT